ncbi:MAG: hypothetical protein DMF66_13790 [Acidobacteria bacterium]|nr:MAG: hypothetical protein DMF66_13790 [Acidobacteriota bacterium]
MRTARQGALFALTDWANKRGVNEGVTEIRDIKKGGLGDRLEEAAHARHLILHFIHTNAREGGSRKRLRE